MHSEQLQEQVPEAEPQGSVARQRLFSLKALTKGVLKHRVQIVEIIHGSAVTIQALHSDVMLHVPDGVYGIILGNILTDHWRFRHLVADRDCIISPICEYFFKKFNNSEKNSMFRLQVPHIVQNIQQVCENIEVKYQRKQHEVLTKAKRIDHMDIKLQNSSDGFYSLHKEHIEICTQHFSKFIITAREIECCCHSAKLLVFSKMADTSPLMADVSLYFTSVHYNKADYLQSVQNDELVNGRQLVKSTQMYLSDGSYEVSQSFVEVKFHTKDEDDTERWRAYRESKLYKKWMLGRILHYIEKHLCKSAPLSLPPVLLVPLKQREKYQLELTVRPTVVTARRWFGWFSSKHGDSGVFEDEPVRLVFDPRGSTSEETLEEGISRVSMAENEPYLSSGRKLTDGMILSLSRRINNPGHLRRLAIKGLGMKDYDLGSHLQNTDDINEAAISVLNDWKLRQENSTIAYNRLCDILRRVKLSYLISDVLKGDDS